MVDLALVNEELNDVVAERALLREKHKGATMPEDARERDRQLTERAQKLRFLVEEENQKERDRIMEETADFLTKPATRPPHNVNPDDEGRKIMLKAGWDIRGGHIFRETASGAKVLYCPEEVMFGPVPHDDAVAARYYHQTRATFQPEYRDAFAKLIRARGRMGALGSAEQNALSEGSVSGGGVLVPPDVAAEIMARRADASVMRRLASVRTTSRDKYQIPAVAPHGTSGSIYSSGFVGGLVGETPSSNTDVGPTFQQYEISIKHFEAYTKVSNDLIDDSVADVMGFLATDGGRNLGLVEDNYFINGTGAGLEPLGLLNAGISTSDVEGSTTDTISNTTTAAGSAPKIITTAYAVPDQYSEGPNVGWLMRRAIQGKVHGLVDADNRPWWQPAGLAGGSASAPGALVGMPVYNSPFMPTDGTNGNKVMVVGDFSAYLIADRSGISVTIDDVNLVGSAQTQIFIRSRAGGGLWNTDALRVGIV